MVYLFNLNSDSVYMYIHRFKYWMRYWLCKKHKIQKGRFLSSFCDCLKNYGHSKTSASSIMKINADCSPSLIQMLAQQSQLRNHFFFWWTILKKMLPFRMVKTKTTLCRNQKFSNRKRTDEEPSQNVTLQNKSESV